MQKENVELKEKQTGKTQHLTGKDVLIENIDLGGTEEKSSGKFNYRMTQVLYNDKPFVIMETGKMKIFFHSIKKHFLSVYQLMKKTRIILKKLKKESMIYTMISK